ncbi:hypothetical protein [Streptomyces sp. NPDC091278]|uniref:hypothetical protein n=1 Tax=Streptomyces sp. NPDC091278 TaxID=3155301 RepID=UPI00344E83F1
MSPGTGTTCAVAAGAGPPTSSGTSPPVRPRRPGTTTTLTRLKSAVKAERAVRERQGVSRRRHLTEQREYADKRH